VGRGLTPNLDALAARGTSYHNVRTTVPLTLPAHVSIMTGLPPYAHGVRENGVVFDGKRATIARRFRDAGYDTAAFVGAYVLNRRFGLDDGFEVYNDDVRRDVSRAEQLEAERPAGEVVDAALAWLKGATGAFFLWVHVYDPHAPYAPPAEFLTKAHGSAYDGEVAYADSHVGRLLDALSARAGETIVAVTSDHGESLGEHGEQTHGMLAYDSTLRVPMILAGGGIGAGVRDATPRSLVDLGARLLVASGLETTQTSSDVYAESRYPRRAGWHPLSVLADEQWKLITSSELELYDMRADTSETTNVADMHQNIVQAMQAQLVKLRAAAVTDAKVAPEAAARLRALGYVSGSSAITTDDPKAPNPVRVIAAWTQFETALGELQSNRASAALAALRALATAHPNAPVFQSTYAQALREAGRAKDAVVVYKTAVGKWPNDPALFHDLAVAAREAGDAAEATRAEHAALALDGGSPMVFNGLGLLHADAGRHAEAAAVFEKAARGDPTNPSYWTNLANARRGLNDGSGAESAYRKALEVDTGFPDALNGLGTLYVQSRRSAEAIPMFQRALQRDAQLHEARLNLGIAYQEIGEREKAAAAYRDLLAKAPPSLVRERQAATELLRQLR
jgi:Flp pilus assembly protein TadD